MKSAGMVASNPTLDKKQWAERLIVLRHAFDKNRDIENTRKLTELIEKVKDEELLIAFCGHFSAGKSSLINQLIGEELLPSSPIPTTGNLAKIKSGKSSYARVYFNEGTPVEFPYPYDLDEIRKFAVDGDSVKSLEIGHPIENFGPGVTILDTPGVDSTDEVHRAATESALHLADVVFYVTDYNHVQSQLNLAFLKQLNDEGKYLVLVVNQIDKHSPAELDFTEYRKGIETAFSQLHIKRTFYTSLKDFNHPENQIQSLRAYVTQLVDDKDKLVVENAESSARHLINKHIDWKMDQQKVQREQFEQTLGGMTEEERWDLASHDQNLESQLKEQQEKPAEFLASIKAKIKQSLDSAILMPHATREAARKYIESEQADFKKGLFFSKKKTEEEKHDRLRQFHEQLTETASTLDWKIKDLIVKESQTFGVQDGEYLRSVYDVKVQIPEHVLTDLIQDGATLNGDYVLRYCGKVAEAVKKLYRDAALRKVEEARERLENEMTVNVTETKTSLAEMKGKIEALEGLQQLAQDREDECQALNVILAGQVDGEDLNAAVAAYPEEKEQAFIKSAPLQDTTPSKENDKPVKQRVKRDVVPEVPSHNFKERMQRTARQLRESAWQIEGIKGIQSAAGEMRKRAQRLEENQFTIALFGAFSAGKSSFANALIGDNILPVSPNPTTAAINKILPVDEQHPHKTVCVKLKSWKDMLADVNQALTPFDETVNSLSELPKQLEKLNTHNSPQTSESKLSFLKAVAGGLAEMDNQLGKENRVDIEAFHDLATNEEKACFVEWIELYYDCPLTRQGITLVDTPGADSMNVRHTGVAFDYIKNADAVLFVTYYNHPFSRADREFLIQLGRVKDTFAMDKMFFIVNAADLASSESERDTVVDYVEKNLISYGIRQPRIYPLSSQKALAAKLYKCERKTDTENGNEDSAPFLNTEAMPMSSGKNGEAWRQNDSKDSSGPLATPELMLESSGMNRFENEFMRFTMEELTDIAVKAAHEDIKRVTRTLDSFIASAQEDEGVRSEKRRTVTQTKTEIITFIKNIDTTPEQRALGQKIDKLVYYINQRVFLRYMDAFKEAFNPSVLSNTESSKKKDLHACLDELLQFIGFDLAQEMRATALRVETFTAGLLADLSGKIEEKVQEQANDYSFKAYEKPSFSTATFENGLQDVKRNDFADILSLFKNAKQFFENNGQKEMRDQLEERLQQPVADYLSDNGERIKDIYGLAFEQEAESLKQQLAEQTEEYADGQLEALSADVDIDVIVKAKKEIEKTLESK